MPERRTSLQGAVRVGLPFAVVLMCVGVFSSTPAFADDRCTGLPPTTAPESVAIPHIGGVDYPDGNAACSAAIPGYWCEPGCGGWDPWTYTVWLPCGCYGGSSCGSKPFRIEETCVEPYESDGNGGCVCVPCRTDADCTDSRSCAVPECDTQTNTCSSVIDPLLCQCSDIPVTYATSFGPWTETLTLSCPIVGGTVGVDMDIDVSGDIEGAACSNGCTASGALTIAGGFTGNLCGAQAEISVSGTASYEQEGCTVCSEATCVESCDPNTSTCNNLTLSADGSIGASRAVGKKLEREFGFAGGQVKLNCGAEINGSVDGGYDRSHDYGSRSCSTCTQCTSDTITFGVNGGATGSCTINIDVGLREYDLIAKDALSIDLGATGTHRLTSGDCGDSYCAVATATVDGHAKTPSFSVPAFGFFKPISTMGCQATFAACSESNSCGSCTCGAGSCSDSDGDFECSLDLWDGSQP